MAAANTQPYAEMRTTRHQPTSAPDSVDEGIALVEKDGCITLANSALQALTGLSSNDFIGQKLADLPPPALLAFGYTSPQEIEQLIQLLDRPEVQSPPKFIFSHAGIQPERLLERSCHPVIGAAGQVAGWVIVLREATGEYQTNQNREFLTRTLVHDLRSPLSAVLSALDVIEDSLPKGDARFVPLQALQTARSSAGRVLGMVESLLDIARLESGKPDLNLNTIHLSALAAKALTEFAAQAHEFDITLTNAIPADLPRLRADQGKILRVLINLLDNALKFTPSGGQITLSARQLCADWIEVQVSDNGPGIPEAYREKIFDRFARFPPQSGRRRGSGLGLSFCRLAVEAHGGRIWNEPRAEGGSIFAFTLPLAGPPARR